MHLEDVLVGHGVEGIRVRADGSADTSEPAIVYAASAVLLFAAMAG
jgi:hypothetical protein